MDIKLTKLLLLTILMSSLVPMGTQAFATTNPYTGGGDGNSITAITEAWGYNNFASSSPTSMTSDLLSVISTSGWNTNANSGSGDATGVIYQGIVRLNNDNNIYADSQVWYKGSEKWDCGSTTNFNANTCPIVDQGGTNSYDYQEFYWSLGTQVAFYTEGDDTNGSVNYVTETYTPGSFDSSNAFADGNVYKTSPNGNYYYKLLQFGMESDSSTSNWKSEQYSMGYQTTGGTNVNLSSFEEWEIAAGASGSYAPYDSTVTWTYDGSGNPVGWHVATNEYDVSTTVNSAGDVTWAPSSSAPSAGTVLWY